MFVCHFVGNGCGCDYTIGCNEKTITLPKHITTLEEAKQWVIEGDDQATDHCGVNEEQYASATLYEVSSVYDVDLEGYFAEQERERAERQRKKAEDMERAELDRLQKKFGKKG